MNIHGFEGDKKNKVCRMRKALYGLKQPPGAWFEIFTKAMKGFGHKQSQGDHTLLTKEGQQSFQFTLMIL